MSEKDYFISFAQQLGELNGNIKNVLKQLEKGEAKMAEHEARISTLEDKDKGAAKGGFGGLPQWAIWVIISLVSLLAGVLGMALPGTK